MEKLYKGVHVFRESYFVREEDFFKGLSHCQRPEVLFITCADSRIDLISSRRSKPGELFIVRNVGNIIPPYDAIKDKNSVVAAIEFAVLVLKVKDIILCGHSNCGAMEALYKDEKSLTICRTCGTGTKIAAPVKEVVNSPLF